MEAQDDAPDPMIPRRQWVGLVFAGRPAIMVLVTVGSPAAGAPGGVKVVDGALELLHLSPDWILWFWVGPVSAGAHTLCELDENHIAVVARSREHDGVGPLLFVGVMPPFTHVVVE